MLTLSTIIAVVWAGLVSCDYGPVSLDSLDPMTLSWNQIHWLVRDQIKEVEEIKKEHDVIYNELTGCYGLEKCLGEFGLLSLEPGSKLHQLGLRVVESRLDLTRQQERLDGASNRLETGLRERDEQRRIVLEEQARQQASLRAEEEIRRLRLEEERLRAEEDRLRLEEERLREANRARQASSRQSYSSSSSSFSSAGPPPGLPGSYNQGSSSSSSFRTSGSSSSSSSSSSRQWINGGSVYEPGLNEESSWTSYFSNQTTYGPKPTVYEQRYEYSSGRGR